MANLQIKGIDDVLYAQIKDLAAAENRSVSQQILFLVNRYIANKKQFDKAKSPAEILLELSGSWQDERNARTIVSEIRKSRRSKSRFKDVSDVLA